MQYKFVETKDKKIQIQFLKKNSFGFQWTPLRKFNLQRSGYPAEFESKESAVEYLNNMKNEAKNIKTFNQTKI